MCKSSKSQRYTCEQRERLSLTKTLDNLQFRLRCFADFYVRSHQGT